MIDSNNLEFGMNTVLQINLDGVTLLKSNLPRLILDNSTSCATSLGTVDVRWVDCHLVKLQENKTDILVNI